MMMCGIVRGPKIGLLMPEFRHQWFDFGAAQLADLNTTI